MRKLTEYQIYNAFSDILQFMKLNNTICDYALCENNKLIATDNMRLIIKHIPISENIFGIKKEDVKKVIWKFNKKRKKLYIDIYEDSENLYIDDLVIKKYPKNFPDWKAVYPDSSKYLTEINFRKSDIAEIIKKFPKIKNSDKITTFINIILERNSFVIKIVDRYLNKLYETILEDFDIVSLEKDMVKIYMNLKFFIDAVNICDELITIKFKDAYNPIYITDEKTFRYIEKNTKIKDKTEMLIMGCVEEIIQKT